MQLLKKKLLRKSNCCSELVTLKKFDKVLSPKNKTILKKSEHMGEGKPPFEKKTSQIRLMITFNLKLFSQRCSLTLISIHGESHMNT